MNQSINSTGRISLSANSVPKMIYTDGKSYLDFYSIRQLCGEQMAKTTLFYLLNSLPNLDDNKIKYRNRSYYDETFIIIHLKQLIGELK